MLTIHDLLQDPVYKGFLRTVPTLPDIYGPDRKPWRLMVLLKGEKHWRSKRYGTYREAFAALKKYLPRAADATINCPAIDWQPPTKVVKVKGKYIVKGKGKNAKKVQVTKTITWKPKMPMDEFEEHYWCPFCRRPTVFRTMDSHTSLPARKTAGVGIDPTLQRCIICGASENIVNLRNPAAHQRWDVYAVR